MPRFKHALFATIALAAFAVPAAADPKPRGSKPADGQMIANMYVGKTQDWKNCRGGIYYGSGGAATAYCHKEGDKANVGIGRWTVTRKGKVCADMHWHWGKGEGNSKRNDEQDCINHIVDKEGQIWRRWNDNKDWWRFDAESVVKGDTLKRKKNKLKRSFGL